ncbi:hypothetical protein OUZ56_030721 [Daphnia magna]|uniref:Uncharacterized protein n=1 Tax=Daphnia magna TaxID=35525 RepID=A0ABQ9ZS59_9CRUS|nr:hypothetical protein OUZ56_030721 [Daphnia magna]
MQNVDTMTNKTQNTADINDNQNGKCRNGNCHDDLAAVKLISSTEDRKQETETLADHAIVIGGIMFSLPGCGFRLDNRIDITRR